MVVPFFFALRLAPYPLGFIASQRIFMFLARAVETLVKKKRKKKETYQRGLVSQVRVLQVACWELR